MEFRGNLQSGGMRKGGFWEAGTWVRGGLSWATPETMAIWVMYGPSTQPRPAPVPSTKLVRKMLLKMEPRIGFLEQDILT